MIDLHSHVLFGLDDGAADLEESLEICRAAAADGITVLAATPHVRARDYPTTADQMQAAYAAVAEAARDLIRIVPGGELDLAELDRPLEELTPFALAGNPRYLLVETPYTGWPLDLADRLFRLRLGGVTPVLAHPERNREVQRSPALLEPLVAAGALVQLTASSVEGREGSAARACAATLLARQLAHLIASDAHTADVRAGGLSGAFAQIPNDDLAHWLTYEVPRAIVDDAALPPRPTARRRRRPLFRR